MLPRIQAQRQLDAVAALRVVFAEVYSKTTPTWVKRTVGAWERAAEGRQQIAKATPKDLAEIGIPIATVKKE